MQLIPGTHITVWGDALIGFKHHGIIGNGSVDGLPTVVHRTHPWGTIESSLWEFTKGREIQVVRTPRTKSEQEAVLSRAYSAIGTVWNPANNCEHLANWASTGQYESLQWNRVIAAGLFALCLVAAHRA